MIKNQTKTTVTRINNYVEICITNDRNTVKHNTKFVFIFTMQQSDGFSKKIKIRTSKSKRTTIKQTQLDKTLSVVFIVLVVSIICAIFGATIRLLAEHYNLSLGIITCLAG